MTTLDPTTGQPLPDSAIQRILFLTPTVHVYGIPPLTSSTSGFNASQWTSPTQPTAQKIFTARLRIIETSISEPTLQIKADIVLEDPTSGQLFAAAPYTSPAVVQQANDSSRFFAVRVQGEGGMKATLGLGFEDRSPAFDFGIALGEVRKVLGMDKQSASRSSTKKVEQEEKKDFSLKEGQTINVQVGSKGRRPPAPSVAASGNADDATALFSIAPPPTAAKALQAPSSGTEEKSPAELGFDDGEFGEFQ
ncbi:unnamed protein product [Lecanosticta acicola]|uniref:Unnamed protein product n=1 Tax=Lecanosticta acicola TaxID=111012 RepID=A0AAI9EBW2_9PEZI|nr:unnamed protein product [Lecanosticta acicola]